MPSNAATKHYETPRKPSHRLSAGWINCLSAKRRSAFLKSLTPDQATFLEDQLAFWLRNEQIEPPGEWRIWLFLGGRGAGKTLAGAHWIAQGIRRARMRRVGIIGASLNDTRAVMIEGESGLLKLCDEASFEPSNRRLLWPCGAIATVLSADEPDMLRGHQFDALWWFGDRAPNRASH